MALTAHQKKVIRTVLNTGARMGADRRELMSAIMTGGAESTWRNLKYGDRDSLGWRQERAMYYDNPTNVKASARRYFEEAREFRGGTKEKPGTLAQLVQQSGFPDRYFDFREQSKDIYKAWKRGKLGKTAGGVSRGGGGGGRGRPGVAPRSSPVGFAQSDVAGLAALLTQQSQPQQPVAASALSAPAHSAGVRLPKGYQAPSGGGGGGAQQGSSVEDAIAQIQQLVGTRQVPEVTGGKTFPGRAPTRGSGGRGGGGASSAKSLGGVRVTKDGKGGARDVVSFAGRGLISSRERTPQENAAVGGAENSDHLTTKRYASAGDLKYGTGRTVAKRLGIKNWKPGTYDRYPVTIKGRKYSVQILENVEGHYDHTHLGVQRIR